MDKFKNFRLTDNKDFWVGVSPSALKKLTKSGLLVLPKLKSFLMKTFVIGVVIYGTSEAKVWGTPSDTEELWMKLSKSNKNLFNEQIVVEQDPANTF